MSRDMVLVEIVDTDEVEYNTARTLIAEAMQYALSKGFVKLVEHNVFEGNPAEAITEDFLASKLAR